MQIYPLGQFWFFEVILTINVSYLAMFGALTILDLTTKGASTNTYKKMAGWYGVFYGLLLRLVKLIRVNWDFSGLLWCQQSLLLVKPSISKAFFLYTVFVHLMGRKQCDEAQTCTLRRRWTWPSHHMRKLMPLQRNHSVYAVNLDQNYSTSLTRSKPKEQTTYSKKPNKM